MIKVENVRFSYGTNPMTFNLSVGAGEKIAIVGFSGAGKSTLLHLLAGFEYAENGHIILDGINHTQTRPYERPVSMLFQDNNLFNHLTVAQNITLGLQPHLKVSDEQQEIIKKMLEEVGLSHYLARFPSELSGGQKQRVSLGRCFLRGKPILLLDEPFSALDKDLRQTMLALLTHLCQKEKLTVLMVTHQQEELSDFVDRVVNVSEIMT
ncbi:MAG: thiamine ABC transporter ATP-binding protein [Ostreibacterium sp.]